MSISASFHKTMSLLVQAVPPSYDFKKHYREGMFEKPNTAGFIHVSHYLLCIYDPDSIKKNVEWPVVCKKTEAKYRNDVKELLIVISNDNPDICFPTIHPSLLLSPGGTKFTKVIWKLSQVALREYIKRQSDHAVLFTIKKGTTEELSKNLINNIVENTNINNLQFHTTLLKQEEQAREYAEEVNTEIKKTQKDIFEQLQIVSSLASKAPIHPSLQKRLLDIDDNEIIQMWKEDLKKNLVHCKNKVQMFKELEKLSKTVVTMATNIISDSTVLNTNFFPKVNTSTISDLPLPMVKILSQNVYTNGNLNLYTYFLLFHTMIDILGQHVKKNGFQDFYDLNCQLEASNLDLKTMKDLFCELHAKVMQLSSEIQQKPELLVGIQDDQNESLIMQSDLKNVMFMPSPPIQFNSNNERHEIQNRLKLTPVEGVHKQLFLRYKKNEDNSIKNASRIVTRINFDDTMSSDINERSPCRRLIGPKTIWSTCKPVGKYSRLFSSHSSQSNNKAANLSLLSMPSMSKANSTAMNNIGDSTSAELTIDLTMIEKKSTPKRSNRFFDIPETSADTNQKCLTAHAELEVKSQKPCSPFVSPVKRNMEKGKRRSITDLVERYKRVMEKSSISNSQLKSVLDTSANLEN